MIEKGSKRSERKKRPIFLKHLHSGAVASRRRPPSRRCGGRRRSRGRGRSRCCGRSGRRRRGCGRDGSKRAIYLSSHLLQLSINAALRSSVVAKELATRDDELRTEIAVLFASSLNGRYLYPLSSENFLEFFRKIFEKFSFILCVRLFVLKLFKL